MVNTLQGISISKVYGLKSYDIEFSNNSLVFLAPNGSFKTTILNIIYHTLAKDWSELFKYDFEKIILKVNNQNYTIEKDKLNQNNLNPDDLNEIASTYSSIEKKYLLAIYSKLGFSLLNNNINAVYRFKYKINDGKEISGEDTQEIEITEDDIDGKTIQEFLSRISERIFKNLSTFDYDFNAILLPTFRRSEKNLIDIIRQQSGNENFTLPLDIKKGTSFISVGFSMDDIRESIEDLIKHNSIAQLEVFFHKCNKYLGQEKKISLTNEKSDYLITNKNKEININDLSSGEKQILAILSFVYLKNANNTVILIDEPEISLSIFWQKEILKDVLDSGCLGIIAATHSARIFQDERIDDITFGLEKFETSGITK